MKHIFINLALFVVFAIAFSGLSACSGSSSAPANGKTNMASKPASNTTPGESKSSAYPPLPSGIAQADLELLDGTKIKAADRKGKVLLLNLWATWCGPCRAEMPELVLMQEKYREKGFQILGLDVGDGDGNPESIEEIKAFSEMMKLNYELARVGNDVTSEVYKFTKFSGIPLSLLVDREGHVRGVFLGGGPKVVGQMKETVEKLMNES